MNHKSVSISKKVYDSMLEEKEKTGIPISVLINLAWAKFKEDKDEKIIR